MSGIFGYIQQNKVIDDEQIKQQKKIFEGIALSMQERGEDGTGIVAVVDEKYNVQKSQLSSRFFLRSKEYRELMASNPPIVIGHTLESYGKWTSDKELQPLRFGSIAGAHSGIIINASEVVDDPQVDSEALFMKLWIKNNKYREVFPLLSGTLTSAWIYDKTPSRIFLLKNDNPLYVMMVQDLKTMFFSSEKFTMEAITQTVLSKTFNAWSPEENHVYEITRRFEIHKQRVSFKPNYGMGRVGAANYEDDYYDDEWQNRRYESGYHYGGQKIGVSSTFWEKDEKIKKLIADFDLDDINILKLDSQLLDGICNGCDKNVFENEDVDSESIYWNFKNKKLLCYECATKDDKILDKIANITFDEYEKLVDYVSWNQIFDNEHIANVI